MEPRQTCARLEDEIRLLERRVEMVSATLDVATVEGRRPRGLVAGLALGSVGLMGTVVTAVLLFLQALSHID